MQVKETKVINTDQINDQLGNAAKSDDLMHLELGELKEVESADLEEVSGGGDGTALGLS